LGPNGPREIFSRRRASPGRNIPGPGPPVIEAAGSEKPKARPAFPMFRGDQPTVFSGARGGNFRNRLPFGPNGKWAQPRPLHELIFCTRGFSPLRSSPPAGGPKAAKTVPGPRGKSRPRGGPRQVGKFPPGGHVNCGAREWTRAPPISFFQGPVDLRRDVRGPAMLGPQSPEFRSTEPRLSHLVP